MVWCLEKWKSHDIRYDEENTMYCYCVTIVSIGAEEECRRLLLKNIQYDMIFSILMKGLIYLIDVFWWWLIYWHCSELTDIDDYSLVTIEGGEEEKGTLCWRWRPSIVTYCGIVIPILLIVFNVIVVWY